MKNEIEISFLKQLYLVAACLLFISFVNAQQPKLILPIGHTSGVFTAAFSNDGKKVVTASADHTAKVWDAQSGMLLFDLRGHDELITCATFSPDGKKILTASSDAVAKIWNAQSGMLLYDLQGHEYGISIAKFSADGKKIITASESEVKIWNAQNGQLLTYLKGAFNGMANIAFSVDGKKILMSCNDGTAKMWDAQSGMMLADLQKLNNGKGIYRTGFSPDGKWIVTASDDGTAKIWNAVSLAPLVELKGHTYMITSVSFSPDSKKVLTISNDGTAKIWEVQSGKDFVSLKGPVYKSTHACFSPDGKTIITTNREMYVSGVYDDTTAKIWDAGSGELLAELKHLNAVNSASYSPDGKKIITASDDYTAKIWDAQSGNLLTDLKGHTFAVESALFSPDGKKILIGGERALIWDVANGALLNDLKGHTGSVSSACFSPDGNKILTASYDRTAKIWDVASGRLLADLRGHTSSVTDASFSPDGKRVITISNLGYKTDTVAKIWDTQSGYLLINLKGHKYAVTSASFSPDGKYIVTASIDMTVKVWDASNGLLLVDLKGHTGSVSSACFSPDGNKILTASNDSTAKIWDAKTGVLLFDLQGHNFYVHCASFSPDGKYILTASMDGIKIWDAVSGTHHGDLKGPFNWIRKASFSPDGKKIIGIAETDLDASTVEIWDVQNGAFPDVLKVPAVRVKSASFSPDGKMIITTSVDNICRIWNAADGALQYTFFAVDSSDYLIVDKDNRYDGTPNARKLLYFSCGTELIGLDQVKDQLWVPNLAERINKGETVNAPKLSDLDICGLLPEVEDIGGNGIYKFKITPRRGGLGVTVLFINNNETKRYKAEELKKTTTGYELTIPKDVIEPYLVSGKQNPVTVKCYTAKNDITSRGIVVIADETKKEIIVPKLYAVVVGVSDYKSTALHLNYAAKDAQDIGNAISISASKLLNKDGKEHVFIYNFNTGKERYSYPDKKSITQIFDTIAKKATANDILLVFFAGHGTVDVDKNNKKQFYFLTSDASSFNNIGESGISSKELIDWIQPKNIKAQKRILIMDACNSGQAINDISENKDLMAVRSTDAGDAKKEIERLNDQSGMFILSASSSTQSAYEFSKYSQGLLTYTLLKAIKQQPDILEENKYLNLSRWFSAAKKSVGDIMNQLGNKGRQEPQLVTNTNFNIGIVDDDVVSKIKLADEKPMFARSEFRKAGLRSDDLKLRLLVDKELNDISSRGNDNDIIYRSDYDGADAYSLSGDYKVEDKNFLVSVSLLKGGNEIKRFDVKGRTDDLQKLAEEIVKKALEGVGKNK